MWLNDKQRMRLRPADEAPTGFPIPTQVVSNGEYMPMAQTPKQRKVEAEILGMADKGSAKTGLDRRSFLKTSAGLATSFLAMNHIYGGFFDVAQAETTDLGAAAERAGKYADQYIVDVQLHFVRDDYQWKGILGLGEYAKRWNPELAKEKITFDTFKFENFLKEVYFDSDTKIGLISAAPADHGPNVIMNNDGLAEARRLINKVAGSRRMLAHSVIAPGQDGWLDNIDHAIEVLKPDSWKGYTLGDPFENSQYPWRLDDEKLMYPAYEKMMKAGIVNVCIHKGLLPADYEHSVTHWRHAMVDDVGKAARDWPGLNFIIYHSGFRPLMTSPEPLLKQFEKTGRIDWVTDLAEVPEKFGVGNVYAELGSTFGSTVVTHPKLAAALLGTVVKGMGADHVIWGTDSVWYGSPQWQIEAMRRIEIPERMQRAHGYAPLGAPDGAVKSAIFAGNSTRLYKLDEAASANAAWKSDELSRVKAEYVASEGKPSNTFYGFVKQAKGAA
jgi:predicted TIM-barrel fold metal-dependent hydrolase